MPTTAPAFKNTRPDLLRPRLRAGMATSRVLIEEKSTALDSSGQPAPVWTTVAGMASLALADWSPRGTERRTGSLTSTKEQRTARVIGRHTITPNTMRATISRYGVTTGVYDILDSTNYGLAGMPMASEGLETELVLELVTT